MQGGILGSLPQHSPWGQAWGGPPGLGQAQNTAGFNQGNGGMGQPFGAQGNISTPWSNQGQGMPPWAMGANMPWFGRANAPTPAWMNWTGNNQVPWMRGGNM